MPSDLFVEGCDVRVPDKRLGSLMQLVNPEAFSDHNLEERLVSEASVEQRGAEISSDDG